MKIILVRGIPACGKSTWARQWAEEDPEHRVLISPDHIRRGLGKLWVPSRELLVRRIKESMLYQALDLGYDVVIDDMHLNENSVAPIEKIATYYPNCTVEFKDFFDVPLSECLSRDRQRKNRVGDAIVICVFNKYKEKYNLKE